MAGTILSSGVRANLLTLQQTTAQQTVIQNRLATGKRVNSAVDNPVNYFTSLTLNDRSSQLTGLLDGISNGIQTIQAASKGIDSATSMVQTLQSVIKQAQSDAAQNRPTKAGTGLATAAEATVTSKSLKDIALDKRIVDIPTGVPADNGVATTATATRSGDLGLTAGANGTRLAISLKTGTAPNDKTYTAAFDGANATLRDVVNEINKSGIATAFVDEKGQLNVKGVGSEELLFGFGKADPASASATDVAAADAAAITNAGAAGTNSNTALGFLAADVTAGTGIKGQNLTSSVRSNLIQQFNDLRAQIDKLAKDTGFNGINLLQGDRLSIVFNEKTGANQTKLDVQGSILSAATLGINEATNTQLDGFINFQNDLDLEKAGDTLKNALTSLRSLASTLGSNLSVAQTRQDFTKEMVNVLKTGADNLVLADPNEEGASLLALNTRQQLSQTALSLANQADQGVLRLFG
ncbi:flagellin N-terminal helical domain-containing protein [Bosea thiooxidans]